jgi:hypothetical protein
MSSNNNNNNYHEENIFQVCNIICVRSLNVAEENAFNKMLDIYSHKLYH